MKPFRGRTKILPFFFFWRAIFPILSRNFLFHFQWAEGRLLNRWRQSSRSTEFLDIFCLKPETDWNNICPSEISHQRNWLSRFKWEMQLKVSKFDFLKFFLDFLLFDSSSRYCVGKDSVNPSCSHLIILFFSEQCNMDVLKQVNKT